MMTMGLTRTSDEGPSVASLECCRARGASGAPRSSVPRHAASIRATMNQAPRSGHQ